MIFYLNRRRGKDIGGIRLECKHVTGRYVLVGWGEGVGEGVKPACTVTFEGQKPYFLT